MKRQTVTLKTVGSCFCATLTCYISRATSSGKQLVLVEVVTHWWYKDCFEVSQHFVNEFVYLSTLNQHLYI